MVDSEPPRPNWLAILRDRLRSGISATLRWILGASWPPWLDGYVDTFPSLDVVAGFIAWVALLIASETPGQSWLKPIVWWAGGLMVAVWFGHWARDYFRDIRHSRGWANGVFILAIGIASVLGFKLVLLVLAHQQIAIAQGPPSTKVTSNPRVFRVASRAFPSKPAATPTPQREYIYVTPPATATSSPVAQLASSPAAAPRPTDMDPPLMTPADVTPEKSPEPDGSVQIWVNLTFRNEGGPGVYASNDVVDIKPTTDRSGQVMEIAALRRVADVIPAVGWQFYPVGLPHAWTSTQAVRLSQEQYDDFQRGQLTFYFVGKILNKNKNRQRFSNYCGFFTAIPGPLFACQEQ